MHLANFCFADEQFKAALARLKSDILANSWYANQVNKRALTEEAGGHMPKYVIERDIPGAGKLSAAELKAISQKSCGVLGKMGPQIQWVQSYVTADKIYCVYIAPNENAVREHAQQGGFPANRVSAVMGVIDPTTAE
jgi:Nickel responsive protein SCO4226-like